MATLNVTPLDKALRQLEAGLTEAAISPNSEIIRDGVTQRFESAHDLAVWYIRRVLAWGHFEPVFLMVYNDILRAAAERGYIEQVEHWVAYRAARRQTLHAYDSQVAAGVFASAAPFLASARILLQRLQERSAKTLPLSGRAPMQVTTVWGRTPY